MTPKILRKNGGNSFLFDITPQQKAETGIDYITVNTPEKSMTVFDFDTGESKTYQYNTKQFDHYVDMLVEHFGFEKAKKEIDSFLKLSKTRKNKP